MDLVIRHPAFGAAFQIGSHGFFFHGLGDGIRGKHKAKIIRFNIFDSNLIVFAEHVLVKFAGVGAVLAVATPWHPGTE